MTNDVFASFKSSYQYKIAGTYNAGFANLARAVNNDDTTARLKSRLTANTIQVNQIKNSGASADEISKKVGQTKLNYLRTASQALYEVRGTTDRLRDARSSLGSLSKDLEASIKEYMKSTTRTAADDIAFKQNAEYIVRKLNATYISVKGRSAAAGTSFDINLYQTNRRLDAMSALLANFPPAGAPPEPAAAAAAVEGGDDGSITGTTASTGQTLDVTA